MPKQLEFNFNELSERKTRHTMKLQNDNERLLNYQWDYKKEATKSRL